MRTTRKARIAYDGPAIANGEMDVRELAPALIAFSDLVANANKVLGGTREIKVMLNQDSLRRGSFDITFLLDVSILEQAKLFMEGAKDSGLDDLMSVLGYANTAIDTAGNIGGIFALIKIIKDRKIKNISHKDNNVNIELADGDIIPTDEKTLKVFLDVNCRISVERVITPLDSPGIEMFELRDPDAPDDKAPINVVTSDEAINFKAPTASDEDTYEEEAPQQEMLAKIVAVNFENGKWRFSDGTNPAFWATVADDKFKKQVDNREVAFTSGDVMRIKYRHKQVIKQGKLTSEYIVDEVMEVKKAPTQIKLDFEYKGENS